MWAGRRRTTPQTLADRRREAYQVSFVDDERSSRSNLPLPARPSETNNVLASSRPVVRLPPSPPRGTRSARSRSRAPVASSRMSSASRGAGDGASAGFAAAAADDDDDAHLAFDIEDHDLDDAAADPAAVLVAEDDDALDASAADAAADAAAAADDDPDPDSPPPDLASRLDFRSRHFDPLLALRADPPLVPPNPNVRPLDNCRKFRPFLPVGDPNRVDPAEAAANRRRRTEASIAAQALAKRRAEKFAAEGERARRREPVLARILDDQKRRGGPMALLARAVEQRLRVTIVTRHASGVRGKAEAYVKAFDRHANLILQDVRETYGVRVRAREEDPREPSGEEGGDADADAEDKDGEKNSGEGAGGARSALGATPEPRRRPKMRLDRRERHVQQVFLRGEQVVSVSVPPAAGDRGERRSEEAMGGDAASSGRGGRGGARPPPPPRPPPPRPPPPRPPPGAPRGGASVEPRRSPRKKPPSA